MTCSRKCGARNQYQETCIVDNKEISQVGTALYTADSHLEMSTYCHMMQKVMFFAG